MEAARRGTSGSRTRGLVALATALALAGIAPAGASALTAHGQLLSLTGVRGNTNQSTNWFGYQLSALGSLGDTTVNQFHQISGDWTVPTVSSHAGGGANQASSDWIGIGGGCVDADCLLPPDPTLIQTGTEQDPPAPGGQPTYSAWWELIPGPSINISRMTISAGDRMHAEISEAVAGSELWTVKLQDTTNGQSFTTTVPYASAHLSAEWIEETPLLISSAAQAGLPNLTNPAFDNARVNSAPAALTTPEELQLTGPSDPTSSNPPPVIGTPSAPDPDADGFAACTWATVCAAPTTS